MPAREWIDRCHFGDVRAVLRQMIDAGVQVDCVVTSPPYWGLRDYGHPGQIGLEPTFAEFLRDMVEVFELVRQVLKPTGTCWINMGDSYAGARRGGSVSDSSTLGGKQPEHARHAHQAFTDEQKDASLQGLRTVSRRRDNAQIPRSDMAMPGLKPKDMIGQPWRLAFALQDAGWWLRQDIIWSKLNPMPESCKDRCTKSHEYVFLLAKNGAKPLLWRAEDTRSWAWRKPDLTERIPAPTQEDPDAMAPRWRGFDYYFDHDAIKEPASWDTHARYARGRSEDHKHADLLHAMPGQKQQTIALSFKHMRKPVAGWANGEGDHSVLAHNRADETRTRKLLPETQANLANFRDRQRAELAEGAYGVGKSERLGRGAGWRDRQQNPKAAPADSGIRANESFQGSCVEVLETAAKRSVWTVPTQSYKGAHFATYPEKLIEPCILAGCPVDGVVLDPFFGSGTTGAVALRLGRHFIGIELNAEYGELQDERLAPARAQALLPLGAAA